MNERLLYCDTTMRSIAWGAGLSPLGVSAPSCRAEAPRGVNPTLHSRSNHASCYSCLRTGSRRELRRNGNSFVECSGWWRGGIDHGICGSAAVTL